MSNRRAQPVPPIAADHPDALAMPTEADLVQIGTAFLNFVALAQQLGHVTPAGSLDYTTFLEDSPEPSDTYLRMVRDFVAWTSGKPAFAPDGESRLRTYVARTGWQVAMSDALGRRAA